MSKSVQNGKRIIYISDDFWRWFEQQPEPPREKGNKRVFYTVSKWLCDLLDDNIDYSPEFVSLSDMVVILIEREEQRKINIVVESFLTKKIKELYYKYFRKGESK